MIYYHCSPNAYRKDDEIRPTNYQGYFDNDKNKVESILEEKEIALNQIELPQSIVLMILEMLSFIGQNIRDIPFMRSKPKDHQIL